MGENITNRSVFFGIVLIGWGMLATSCHDEEEPDTAADTAAADADTSATDSQTTVDMDIAVLDTIADLDTAVTMSDLAGSPDGQVHTDIIQDTAPTDGEDTARSPADNPDCDPLVPSVCALPWPSNLYLTDDPQRTTGFTLSFGATTLPKNNEGVHVDPTPYRRLDGYSIGTSIAVTFPNIDVSQFAGELAIDQSLAEDARVLFYSSENGTLTRVPYWVELDQLNPDYDKRILWVRPAVILKENTRYIVAFRNLVDTRGAPIPKSEAFAQLVAGDTANAPRLASRQARFDDVFSLLQKSGIDKGSLTLAWDFTTASADTIFGPMLFMRKNALEWVGEDGPELTITGIEEFAPSDNGSNLPVDEHVRFKIKGTFKVPDYTEPKEALGATGYPLRLGPDNLPIADGYRNPTFYAHIPHTTEFAPPLELMQYGHGMFGSAAEVWASQNRKIAHQYGYIYFGCNMTGFSEEDVPAVAVALQDLSRIPWFFDRQHQGMIEQLLLGRAFLRRFATMPEISALNLTINTENLVYSGISQGGIYGATYMALSQDALRGHLGVPGQNYNTLMLRSANFGVYFLGISVFYAEPADHAVLLELVHTLWQMTDPVSYYPRIVADPFPDTPSHAVLIAQAQGDWQVANITNEVTVRSDIGIVLMDNYGRNVPLVNEVAYPHTGSGLVNYNFGNPWPKPGNFAPNDDLGDPHELPRKQDHHNEQLVTFLRTGTIIDVCGGNGCNPD